METGAECTRSRRIRNKENNTCRAEEIYMIELRH